MIKNVFEYSIVRVDNENYALHDDMVFFCMNDRERTLEEQAGGYAM